MAAGLPMEKIAFISQRDGNSELYVMNANGSGQTRLATLGFDFGPDWTPDWRPSSGPVETGSFTLEPLYTASKF